MADLVVVARLTAEGLLSVRELAQRVPGAYGRKRARPDTLVRWIQRGRLEGFQTPAGSWVSSGQALVRALAAGPGGTPAPPTDEALARQDRDAWLEVERAKAGKGRKKAAKAGGRS